MMETRVSGVVSGYYTYSDMVKMRFPHKYVIYDYMHKTAITICMISTLGLLGKLVFDSQYYIRKKRPLLLEQSRLKREQELAEEQVQKEEELLTQERLQEKASEVLKG